MSNSQILNPCAFPDNLPDPNLDPPPPNCDDGGFPPSKRDIPGLINSWEEPACREDGLNDGAHALCDPMQRGKILNDTDDRSTVYRYSRALRGTDNAVWDLFKEKISVLDANGRAFIVPCIWASQEKAVVALTQQNVRQDNSLVVDRIKLPAMAIYPNSYTFNQDRYIYHGAINYLRDRDGKPGFVTQERYPRDTVFGLARGIPIDITYTLYVWTMFIEDMNQILEQILLKFSPMAYIRVRGVGWEIGVKLDSIADNLDIEPGDKNKRVIKFEINMTAETFIPQPIVRKKAVLDINAEFLQGLTSEDAIAVIGRLEESVKELR